jgi:hypothetical protein
VCSEVAGRLVDRLQDAPSDDAQHDPDATSSDGPPTRRDKSAPTMVVAGIPPTRVHAAARGGLRPTVCT